MSTVTREAIAGPLHARATELCAAFQRHRNTTATATTEVTNVISALHSLLADIQSTRRLAPRSPDVRATCQLLESHASLPQRIRGRAVAELLRSEMVRPEPGEFDCEVSKVVPWERRRGSGRLPEVGWGIVEVGKKIKLAKGVGRRAVGGEWKRDRRGLSEADLEELVRMEGVRGEGGGGEGREVEWKEYDGMVEQAREELMRLIERIPVGRAKADGDASESRLSEASTLVGSSSEELSPFQQPTFYLGWYDKRKQGEKVSDRVEKEERQGDVKDGVMKRALTFCLGWKKRTVKRTE